MATLIDPITQPIRPLNSSRFISTIATNPLSTLTDDTLDVNNSDIVELSPEAQQLMDYYEGQYVDGLVIEKQLLERILEKNQMKDIIEAGALQNQLAAFDPSSRLLDTLSASAQSNQLASYYDNTLTNAQPEADNDNLTYQQLQQLLNVTLLA